MGKTGYHGWFKSDVDYDITNASTYEGIHYLTTDMTDRAVTELLTILSWLLLYNLL